MQGSSTCLVFQDSLFIDTPVNLDSDITLFFTRCVFKSSDGGGGFPGLKVNGNIDLADCAFAGWTSAVVDAGGSQVRTFKACGTNITGCDTAVTVSVGTIALANCYLTGFTAVGITIGGGSEQQVTIAACCFEGVNVIVPAIDANVLRSLKISGSAFSGKVQTKGWASDPTVFVDDASCFRLSQTEALPVRPSGSELPDGIFGREACKASFKLGNESVCDAAADFPPAPTPVPPFPRGTKTPEQPGTPVASPDATRIPASSAVATPEGTPLPSPLASPEVSPQPSPSPSLAASDTPARSHTRSLTRTRSKPATALPMEQISGNAALAGGLGGGLGGLAALAALLLLFLLFKKKKNAVDDPLAQLETDVTLDEESTYISEYGMSDGAKPQDHDDDGVGDDIPRSGNGPEDDDDSSGASEHNPDEIAGAESEA
jgi:hypothetical protein